MLASEQQFFVLKNQPGNALIPLKRIFASVNRMPLNNEINGLNSIGEATKILITTKGEEVINPWVNQEER